MSHRRLSRGPLTSGRLPNRRAAAAVVALGILPFALSSVLVVPAYASATTPASASALTSPTAPTLRTDDITWNDVAAAQASVDATAALVKQLTASLAALQAQVDSTQADADAKGVIYGKAQDAFDAQAYVVQTYQGQIDVAEAKAEQTKKTADQMIAAISKTSAGGDLTAKLLTGSDPSAQLSRLGTYQQVTNRSAQIMSKYLAYTNTITSLKDKADAAQAILAKLKDTAEATFNDAQAAAASAQTALAAQQAQQAQLQAKLSVLQQHRDATLADYNATLLAKWGPGAAGVVSASGWANPANGFLGDRFGMRFHPIFHVWMLHSGQDISGTGCGANIYAAHAGTVIYAGPAGGLGNFVELDNGGGVLTGYAHIVNGGILVSLGQHVGPGQNIAKVGTTGTSTGCHLHFTVRVNGVLIDPLPFMRDRGVTLG